MTGRSTNWSTTTSCGAALARVPGGDFVDYYAAVKRAEVDAYHATVSESEIDRSLTLM